MSTDALAGPIVGRDAELAQLDAMLGMLAGGASACVAVEGERGIIALENARLPTESQTRLAELQASRERIVAAGDAERRRLERNLHDGAEQRLVAIALQLRLIQSHIHGDPSSVTCSVTAGAGARTPETARPTTFSARLHRVTRLAWCNAWLDWSSRRC